jgi:hypothetical protein
MKSVEEINRISSIVIDLENKVKRTGRYIQEIKENDFEANLEISIKGSKYKIHGGLNKQEVLAYLERKMQEESDLLKNANDLFYEAIK